MFGAGLPVAALAFPCVAELITDGTDGRLVADARGLAAALHDLIAADGADAARAALRAGVANADRWDAMWARCVRPVVQPAFDA